LIQLYLWALGSLFVASYGSQGYGGVVLTRLHTGALKTDFLLKIYKNSVRTSKETHYVSVTETNRLMLFGETVAVYCENHTEYTDTVRVSQETQYVSATEPNRLMLFR
jgi:hypothetical protein